MEKNFDQRGFIKIAVRNERGTRERLNCGGELAYCFSSEEKWDGYFRRSGDSIFDTQQKKKHS